MTTPPWVDARHAQGLQVGDHNTQHIHLAPHRALRPLVVGSLPGSPPVTVERGELDTLAHELAGRGRAVACLGPLGVGKSQLAATHARRRLDEDQALVCWIDAGSRAGIIAGLDALAEAVDRADPGGSRTVSARNALGYLNAVHEPTLVVYDNARDPDETATWLPTSGAAQVVITSTHRGFDQVARPLALGPYTPAESVAYLQARAHLSVREAGNVAAALDRLPLALASAASLITRRQWTGDRYLDELARSGLDPVLPKVPTYPHTVTQAFIRTIQALEKTPDAPRVLLLLSLLDSAGTSRSFLEPLLRARAPQADVDDALTAIASSSLATIDPATGRVVVSRLAARLLREQSMGADRHTRNLLLLGGLLTTQLRAGDHSDALRTETWRHAHAHLQHLRRVVADPPVPEVDVINATAAAREIVETAERQENYSVAGTFSGLLRDVYAGLLGPSHPFAQAYEQKVVACRREAHRVLASLSSQTAVADGADSSTDSSTGTGADGPLAATGRADLARAHHAAGRLDEAIALYESALAELEGLVGRDDLRARDVRRDLVRAYQEAGPLPC